MVIHLSLPHHLTFNKKCDMSLHQPHNARLHIKSFIDKHQIKLFLIDGGVGLKICTLKLALALGLFEGVVDSKKKMTIKTYNDEECSFKGTITLLVRVGPVVQDVVFQVLDLDLTYNIILVCSWIHVMLIGFTLCEQFFLHTINVSKFHTMV